MYNFATKMNEYCMKIDISLEKYLPNEDFVLSKAMRYSVFAGGKRIRPIITLAFCDLFGGNSENAVPLACAIEMIHTYSLIYDDLPCMDNDTLRRGKPTNHVVFGESTALMAGSALYSRSFEIILQNENLSDKIKIEASKILLSASGADGIVTGQILDIDNKAGLSLDEVVRIHTLKTGMMLNASALLGCIAADCGENDMKAASLYAEKIGLAFQIRDDILDITGSTEELGKTVGKDKAANKTTFVDIMGEENAQSEVKKLTEEAKKAIAGFNGNDFLNDLSDFLSGRKI